MPHFSEQQYEDFVGENVSSYVPFFLDLDTREGKFKFSWVWPALFFQFIWFYYRKMYFWGTVFLLLRFVRGINLLSILIMPLVAKYLYYRHAQKKLSGLGEIEETFSPGKIGEIGGVNVTAVWICVGLTILSFILLIFLFNIFAIERLGMKP
jgi:hypothetical protein